MLRTSDMQGSDDAFFDDTSDWLEPFVVPVATWQTLQGSLPWCELDASGDRLIRFAQRFGSYEWTNDARQPEQVALLQTLASGDAEAEVNADFELLWHTLFAVVRADRFNEGLIASHALALTRIANELRRRLMLERARTDR
jgi:hypothetical protein